MSAKDTIVVQRCGLSAKELNEFLSSYPIPSEYDVIFRTSTQTIFDAPPGYVGLYTHSFSLANLRLPLTDFFWMQSHRSNVLFPFHKKVSRRNLICYPHVLRFKEDLGGLRSDSFMRFYQRRLMCGLKLWAYLEPIPSICRCRNKMRQGLAHRPVIMGVSRDLRDDSWGLTFAQVWSKAHREGVGLRVADSHTGNHPEGGFTPFKTIRRLLVVIRRRSHLGFQGETFES
ncbi:hypothetical protein Tco_0644148 [Tanacetum coccineum]